MNSRNNRFDHQLIIGKMKGVMTNRKEATVTEFTIIWANEKMVIIVTEIK